MIENINSFVDVAKTHIVRLEFALDYLQNKMPMTAAKVKNMNDQDFLYLEVLTGRFLKLQDYVGKQLIDIYLETHKEYSSDLTMIDKLNKLEKIGILNNITTWDEYRQLRNHLIHEYPNQPEITAEYLNKTYQLSTSLITFTKKLIENF